MNKTVIHTHKRLEILLQIDWDNTLNMKWTLQHTPFWFFCLKLKKQIKSLNYLWHIIRLDDILVSKHNKLNLKKKLTISNLKLLISYFFILLKKSQNDLIIRMEGSTCQRNTYKQTTNIYFFWTKNP